MAITMIFSPVSMTRAQFDAVHRDLDAAGWGTPAGRLVHVCYGSGDKLQVLDVWESQEAFAAFGAQLMPVLAAAGIDPGQPQIFEHQETTLAG